VNADLDTVWVTGTALCWTVGLVVVSVRTHRNTLRETDWYFLPAGMVWWLVVPALTLVGLGYLAHRAIGLLVKKPTTSGTPSVRDAEGGDFTIEAQREVEEICQ